jgi:uncharacterized protein Yka (UPF0111/DUF47 family)
MKEYPMTRLQDIERKLLVKPNDDAEWLVTQVKKFEYLAEVMEQDVINELARVSQLRHEVCDLTEECSFLQDRIDSAALALKGGTE